MWWRMLAGAAVLISLLGGSAGCGSGSDSPMSCQDKPHDCAAGTTCWPVDKSGGQQCLPSKNYVALGDDCALLVGLTTCGDGLVCAPMIGRNKVQQTRCTPYCDDAHACPAQATCTPVALFAGAPMVAVCILPPPM